MDGIVSAATTAGAVDIGDELAETSLELLVKPGVVGALTGRRNARGAGIPGLPCIDNRASGSRATGSPNSDGRSVLLDRSWEFERLSLGLSMDPFRVGVLVAAAVVSEGVEADVVMFMLLLLLVFTGGAGG